MKRVWMVASYVVLTFASLVAVLGLGWLCLGFNVTLLYMSAPMTLFYAPRLVDPANVYRQPDVFFIITASDRRFDILLLAVLLLIDVAAAMAVVRIAAGRGGWLRIAGVLLSIHLGLALGLWSVSSPLYGTGVVTILYMALYIGSALGAFAATLIGLILNLVRVKGWMDATS